eukprot:g13056.t1
MIKYDEHEGSWDDYKELKKDLKIEEFKKTPFKSFDIFANHVLSDYHNFHLSSPTDKVGTLTIDGASKGTKLSFDFNMGHENVGKDTFGGSYNNVNYEIAGGARFWASLGATFIMTVGGLGSPDPAGAGFAINGLVIPKPHELVMPGLDMVQNFQRNTILNQAPLGNVMDNIAMNFNPPQQQTNPIQIDFGGFA